MNRFFIEEKADNKNLITNIEDVKHISKVLRLKKNDLIEVVDIDNEEYLMKISQIQNNNIELINLGKIDIKREPDVKITLYQGIPKNPKMDLICQKMTEVGVFEIIPVLFERCVATEINQNKITRLQKIMDESAKQSKRQIIPTIYAPITFEDMIVDLEKNDKNILFYEDEKKEKIKDFINLLDRKIETLGIIIGPEGGISEKEIEIIKKYKINILTLGNRILRTETAGIVSTSILLHELEN